MPNQPGSAPSKRVSAKDVLEMLERHNAEACGGDSGVLALSSDRPFVPVVLTALRLLARAEDLRIIPGEEEPASADVLLRDAVRAVLRRMEGYAVPTRDLERGVALLCDLAALVAPTDAEER